MNNESERVDRDVRRFVYDVTLQRGRPPSLDETSTGLELPRAEIVAAFRRLAAGRVLVLQPGSDEVLMANPFSAVPTPFLVELDDYSCYGNCIWDALGIAAMRERNGQISTACGDCGAAMEVAVVNGAIRGDDGVMHFAVPAHHWWDDIVFN